MQLATLFVPAVYAKYFLLVLLFSIGAYLMILEDIIFFIDFIHFLLFPSLKIGLII